MAIKTIAKGFFKVVDISEHDDEFSPLVKLPASIRPWHRDAIEEWVEQRLWTDERTLVVREYSPDEYREVLVPILVQQYDCDEWQAMSLISELEPCCDAGGCDDECWSTGDCSGSCERICECMVKPEPVVSLRACRSYAWLLACDKSTTVLEAMKDAGLLP